MSGLRDVNESLGHAAGDKLLAEVARRLRSLAPPAALIARVGGDEFAMTLRMAGTDEAVELASELRRSLQDPMELGSLTLDVDTAVGIAVHPDHGSEPAALLQRADVANQAAKSMSSAVQVFNLGLESRSARRLGLAGDLRRALENGEVDVVFQPKVTLGSRQLVGVECLARWEHSAHGTVSPEDFVAVAEHTGQLGRLTETVLMEGLRRCRQWADAGRPLNVAVNLSSRTLQDPRLPQRIAAMLDAYDAPPFCLSLEITENILMSDPVRSMDCLKRLHEMGVRLVIDEERHLGWTDAFLKLVTDAEPGNRAVLQGWYDAHAPAAREALDALAAGFPFGGAADAAAEVARTEMTKRLEGIAA